MIQVLLTIREDNGTTILDASAPLADNSTTPAEQQALQKTLDSLFQEAHVEADNNLTVHLRKVNGCWTAEVGHAVPALAVPMTKTSTRKDETEGF